MIKGFRDFIMRGNVIDLAVAVVIGGAFTAIVNAIVTSVINPLIGLVYQPDPATGAIGPKLTGIHGEEVTFPLGELITAVISFFAVALVVYLVFVVPMNKWKERQAAKAGVVEDAAKLPTEAELLIQIRDLLERNNAATEATSTAPAPADAPLRRSQNTPPAAPSA
ncbi:large conductance mechanosensitive channel protein MscL [Microbacterium sp. cf332]|uniref:large conductance mechanosensitive channel protein MscL n=1 Tax=Microbacterium sp. cf332 TaxID=1761804 RepID=UPI000881F720|nr:large conductance mechanosensitive channel protein MscL [Microbacterium sp. cf332]SDQ89909.1 large conductance mechanosensitive channel [Microbacterium sp. cf332]